MFATVGVKVTVTCWLLPEATVKFDGLTVNWASLKAILLTIRSPLPLFLMVMILLTEKPFSALQIY